MADSSFDEYQRQTLELLRSQQQAFLEAVRAWQKATGASREMPGWPEPPSLDMVPTATELAEASSAFAAKLFDEQSRFMHELSETLAASGKRR